MPQAFPWHLTRVQAALTASPSMAQLTSRALKWARPGNTVSTRVALGVVHKTQPRLPSASILTPPIWRTTYWLFKPTWRATPAWKAPTRATSQWTSWLMRQPLHWHLTRVQAPLTASPATARLTSRALKPTRPGFTASTALLRGAPYKLRASPRLCWRPTPPMRLPTSSLCKLTWRATKAPMASF